MAQLMAENVIQGRQRVRRRVGQENRGDDGIVGGVVWGSRKTDT